MPRTASVRLISTAIAMLLSCVVVQVAIAQQPACVDINKASAKDLERIIHIGPERAGQIVALRKERPRGSRR